MAPQSAVSPRALCKLLIYLLLLFMLPNLMQCRRLVPKISRLEHKPVDGLRIDLVHRDSSLSPLFPGNITSTERVKQAVQRSQERLETLHRSVVLNAGQLAHKSSGIQAPISAGSGEYTMKVEIGEPSISYSGILDTGSDLIWTQCLPCDNCSDQSYPIYDPSQSSTYRKVTCESPECPPNPNFYCSAGMCHYTWEYGDYSTTSGILSYDTFTFSSESVDQIVFGCGQYNDGQYAAHGGVGFGRGSLSLISQLGSLGANKFSYCLQGFEEPSYMVSPLFIGHTATLNAEVVSSTPFIQNAASSFYFLSLEGISLGGKLLNIDASTFDIQDDGSGGFMIDSGTTFTLLHEDAYQVLKKALISAIHFPQTDGSGLGLDLCFDLGPVYHFRLSSNQFPTMTFHFKGADYVLQPEHYFYVDDTTFCLAMLPTSQIQMSILGNYQQQNYHILYDNGNNMLSFAPTDCDSL